MEKTKEELELEQQVEKIRRKRQGHGNRERTRAWLNTLFMLLAAAGLIWYFTDDQHHVQAMGVIAAGMLLKVVEFFIRFVF